jgi:fructokinase
MSGSILAYLKPLSCELNRILDIAAAGATVLYDPNIRKDFIPDIENVRPLIDSNIRYADIVRASDEDMLYVGGCRNADEAYEYMLAAGCYHLIYTTAGRGVYLRTPSLSKCYKTPDLETVSTVGAGDSFNAGVVHTLYRKGINRKRLKSIPEAAWDDIVKTGIAAEVCTSGENYISMQYALSLISREPDTNIYKC